jgi:hypothetical protein
MLASTLWLFILFDPAQVKGYRSRNVLMYMFSILGYTAFKGLASVLSGNINNRAVNSKKILIFSQIFLAQVSALMLYFASNFDHTKLHE